MPNSVMVIFYLPLSEDPSVCPEVSPLMLPQGLIAKSIGDDADSIAATAAAAADDGDDDSAGIASC